MTVSKKPPSWPCVIGALALLVSPVAADAQQAAGAQRRAAPAPQTAGAPPAAGAQRRAPGAPQATGLPRQAPGAPRAAGAQREPGGPPPAGAQREPGGPPPAGAQRAPGGPPPADAQRATGPRGRAVPRTARPVLRTRAWYGPGYGYYSPYYYPGYLYGPGWGLHPFGPWAPYQYWGGYYRERGSVRLQVKPEETEVYVDGYYAGVVDSYDGFFQRLSLPPGRHDIELRLEGYRSIQEQVYLGVGQTYRIEHMMEPLGPGETTPPPPEPQPEADVEPGPEPDAFFPPGPDAAAPPLAPAAGFGRLVVRVQPSDASIFVDGEEWYSPDGSRLELEVGAGRHRIEVRREGYESYVTDVAVRSGESRAVNISLPRNRPEAREEPAPGPGA